MLLSSKDFFYVLHSKVFYNKYKRLIFNKKAFEILLIPLAKFDCFYQIAVIKTEDVR